MLDARLSQAEKLINLTSKVNSEVSNSKTKTFDNNIWKRWSWKIYFYS